MKNEQKLEQIYSLVRAYIEEKREKEVWVAGRDWVKYSGPHYDAEEYISAISTLMGEWLVFGEKAREFEKVFSQYMGKRYGVLTNSGSSANLLMVSALNSKNKLPEKYRIPRGLKFITPVVCFPTTLNPLLQNGYKPVFVDVDLPSLNLNLDQVEEVLKNDHNREIKGIIFAHVVGNPPDMDRLMRVVEKYNLTFLEDSCDALGSFYDGKRLGSFGVMSTCSFYPAHHMTLGEGGFVATNSYQFRRTLASFRDWGRACYCNELKAGDVTCETACGDRFKCWLPKQKDVVYDHRYVFDEVGYNLKPLDLQAAMGLEQINKLPLLEEARRANFKLLSDIFEPYQEYIYLPKATEKSDPCWFSYMFVIKDSAPFTREQLTKYLEDCKIQTRPYFTGNLLDQPAYQHIGCANDSFAKYPNADIATRGSLMIGTYIGMTEMKINYIKDCVDTFMGSL
jgi:CDP-6-deoxy-D-xylo-4-hexulose-3-dehydrase